MPWTCGAHVVVGRALWLCLAGTLWSAGPSGCGWQRRSASVLAACTLAAPCTCGGLVVVGRTQWMWLAGTLGQCACSVHTCGLQSSSVSTKTVRAGRWAAQQACRTKILFHACRGKPTQSARPRLPCHTVRVQQKQPGACEACRWQKLALLAASLTMHAKWHGIECWGRSDRQRYQLASINGSGQKVSPPRVRSCGVCPTGCPVFERACE